MDSEVSLPSSQEPTTFPILSRMNPVKTLPPYHPKIHSNIILQSTPRSSTLPFTFSYQT
jgi:hypothetical protein